MCEYLVYDWDSVFEFFKTLYGEDIPKGSVLLTILSARKKYYPGISSQEVLNFTILKNITPSYIKRKLIALTIYSNNEELLWEDNKRNKIPKKAFVVYHVLNPRSPAKALVSYMQDFVKLAGNMLLGNNISYNFRNIDRALLSNLHKKAYRSLYWIIDIDVKDKGILSDIISLFDGHIKWVTETQGGYHVIVNVNQSTGILIYKDSVLCKYTSVEVKKDAMSPIPGTYQAGFKVRKYDF